MFTFMVCCAMDRNCRESRRGTGLELYPEQKFSWTMVRLQCSSLEHGAQEPTSTWFRKHEGICMGLQGLDKLLSPEVKAKPRRKTHPLFAPSLFWIRT